MPNPALPKWTSAPTEQSAEAAPSAGGVNDGWRRFYDLLDRLGMLALVLDGEGRVTYTNPKMLELTGWRSDEIVGRSAFEILLPPDRVPAMRAVHRDVLADRPTAWNTEVEIVTRTGERRLTYWSNTVLHGSTGRAVGSVHLGEDITDRRAAEKEIASSEERYRQLFNACPLPMWVYDLETLAFLAVNDAAVRQYGFTREEFLARTIADIRPNGERARLANALTERRKNNDDEEAPTLWRHRLRNGTTIEVEITSHPLVFKGRSARLVVANDVSARFEQQLKIERLNRIRAVMTGISSAMLRSRDREELLQEACRVATTEGVFPMAWASEIDPDGRMRVLAFSGPEPASLDFIQRAKRGELPENAMPTRHAIRTGRPYVINDLATEPSLAPVRSELVGRGFASGAAFPLSVAGVPVGALVLLARDRGFFDDDEIALLEWMAADLSFALEHLDRARRLDYLAYYDDLTGIANARLFGDRLEQHIHTARQQHTEVCLVVFDIENFTRLNDTLGRSAGDEVLRRIAQRFDTRLLEPYAFGRIGGDTFAVASPREQQSITTYLRDTIFGLLGEPFELGGRAIHVEAQAGIAIFPTDGGEGATLFQNAETALMLARSEGERCVWFSAEMNARVARRHALVEELRHAIAEAQFVVHYQPRIDLTSGALVGAEALLRWQRPGHGLASPGEFIELAEETGLVVPIGEWIIDTVCAQQADWSARGVGVVPIAVNLSASQFGSGDLLRTVAEALARHGVDPGLFDLELTETAVMRDPEAAAATLGALSSLGVRLALDDFGTGYSSLAHLKRFPFDAVKIDRSFVADITTNPEDAAIATAIIAMAHRLELKVVAEGVESTGQLNYLRAEGCDEMQGNLFSAAIAAGEFERMLRGSRRMTMPPQEPENKPTVLIVDNEPGVRSALVRVLRPDGYRILTADSGREGLEILAQHAVQVVISDQRMPGMSGTEFLGNVRRLYPATVRIVLSGYADLGAVTDAINHGEVFKYLVKPWDDETLRDQVRAAFRRHRPAGRFHA